MLVNPIRLVTVHFIDGSTYQVENEFEELLGNLDENNDSILHLKLPNGQKVAAMKATVSRIISK